MNGFVEDFQPGEKESVEFWEMISTISQNLQGNNFFW
jgi:hypothetical protein